MNELKKIVYKIREGGRRVSQCLFYPWRKLQYRHITFSSVIHPTNSITPEYIECGERVYIGFNARIQGIKRYNEIEFSPIIKLEDGVSIQQNIHLTCANSIVIGKNTAIAANVTITDIHHPYENIDIPIEQQNIEVGSVHIGEDCKIYNNAVILPNVTIGKHVTVGANSVVTKDIPNYCVAVGIPAKIIKRYDFTTQSWRKTNPQGEFIN